MQDTILNLPLEQRTPEQSWKVALNNYGLVVILIDRKKIESKTLFEDLVQEGLLAAYHAATHYRPPYYPVKFSSYCRRCIISNVERYLYGEPIIPIKENTLRHLRKKPAILTRAMNDAQRVLSMERSEESDVICDDSQCYDAEDFDILEKTLATLEPSERELIEHYYGIGTDAIGVKQIAKVMAMSRHAASRLRDKAFNKLQHRVKVKNGHTTE